MAAEQVPAAQHTVGGQVAVTGWDVIEQSDSFIEDAENTPNANGTHRCKITYSRRLTHDLSLQAQSEADASVFSEGGTYKWNTNVDCTIESATARKTRGPTMVDVSLLEQVDQLA